MSRHLARHHRHPQPPPSLRLVPSVETVVIPCPNEECEGGFVPDFTGLARTYCPTCESATSLELRIVPARLEWLQAYWPEVVVAQGYMVLRTAAVSRELHYCLTLEQARNGGTHYGPLDEKPEVMRALGINGGIR